MRVPLTEVSGIFFKHQCNLITVLTYNKIKTKDIFVELIGIILIFAAADMKRIGESKIDLISGDYLLQAVLISVGLILVISSELAQHAIK